MSIKRSYFSWKMLNEYLGEQEDICSYYRIDDMKYNLPRLGYCISQKMRRPYQCWLWWLSMLPRLFAVWCRLKMTRHYPLPNNVIRLMDGDKNTTLSAIKLSYFYIGLFMLPKEIQHTPQGLLDLWARWILLINILVRRIRNA